MKKLITSKDKKNSNKFLYNLYCFVGKDTGKKATIYNTIMLLTIIISLICLTFKQNYFIIQIIEIFTVSIFILDYFIRLILAGYNKKNGALLNLIYPFTPWAIIDLLSILPSFSLLSNGFKIFRIMRVSKILRSLRILRLFKVSKEIHFLFIIWKKEKRALISFGYMAAMYIFITALMIFNVEPETFNHFFDAIYWATISLTTVGYGDIYAVSTLGKIITMLSSLFGIALIAMPASIITAGIMEEISK